MELIGRTTLTREFDGLGREIRATRWIRNRAPDLFFGGVSLQLVKTKETKLQYLPHPFEPRREYLGKTARSESGLIAIDSENKYFDEDFEQDFTEAHKAGNLTEEMTTRQGAIKTVTER